MANWYIDYLNGNDANAGTIGSPKQLFQAAWDVGAGGDTFFLSDSAPHPIITPITSNTGFTLNNDLYTKIKPWNNGGSITIQRPDEAAPRVAAQLDVTALSFNITNLPIKVTTEDIIFSGGNTAQVQAAESWGLYGCKFTRPITADASVIYMQGGGVKVENCFFDNIISTRSIIGAASLYSTILNNYFSNIASGGAFGIPYSFIELAAFGVEIDGNILDISTDGDIGIRIVEHYWPTIRNNTIKSNGGANQYGVQIYGKNNFGTIFADLLLNNNVFYQFNGALSKPISTVNSPSALSYGKNAFFDCNASDSFASIGLDFTAGDVIGAGDPFTNSAAHDYTLAVGNAGRGAALSNPGASLDMGAVQSASSGGGSSSSIFIINE